MDLEVPDATADHGVPAAHAERHAEDAANEAAVLAMPGVTDVALIDDRHRRAGRRPSASASTRSARWTSTGTRAPSRASPTTPSSPRCARPSCRSPYPRCPCSPRRSSPTFTFMFRSSAALEPYAAVADVRADHATVWAGLKVADRRPDGHRPGDRAAQGEGDRQRRSPVAARSATSSSPTTPSRRPGLQGDRQAGPADVAPRRRAAPGPGAPDVHLADPGDPPRRPGAQLRAAAHQRRDRLQPRASAR